MNNEDIKDMNNGKRFDICLMNPPFSGTMHLRFLEKVIKISDKVVSVQPIIWLFGQNAASNQLDKINFIKDNINKYKASIEKIDQAKFFKDAGIAQDTGIISIYQNEKSNKVNIIDINKNFTVDNVNSIKKYGNNKLLSQLEQTLKEIYNKDNFWNHIIYGPRAKGHLGKKKNEEKIDFNPNLDDIIITMPQIRGHVNQPDFYTACENGLKPVKYKNYNNKGKSTPWSYIICKDEQYGINIANYLKTDFVRSCLYFNKFSTGLSLEIIPWFDFSDEHFSKSPREIDDWLFKKYDIDDKIRKHIEEILPDYYNIR